MVVWDGAARVSAMSSPPPHPNACRRAMSSPPARLNAGDPASQPIFADEILGEIFLRLDSAADLARASAACTAFLRVVRFLRRNRSLYRQPVVGFLEHEDRTPIYPRSFYHAQPPHGSASSARTLAEAADFTCSFLPDPGSWRVNDAAGGRLLLSLDSSNNNSRFEDLVVCDPLQRRYVRIPPVPVDLTADMSKIIITKATWCGSVDPNAGLSFRHIWTYYRDFFFAPTGEEEGSSFRVIRMIYDLDKKKMIALVFSPAIGQWRRVTINGWDWNSELSEVLMFDTHKMVFSTVRPPLVRNCRHHAIVKAGEGKLGFLTIGDGMLDLYCKAWQDNNVSAEEWQHEKTISIPLPDSGMYSISFCGTGDGYLLIQAIPPDSAELKQMPKVYYFTLHVRTLLVERLCMLNKRVDVAHLYANFLPPLSLPSV